MEVQMLRMQQTGASMNRLDIKESPSYKIRILNHWDNLDRTIERGYAGARCGIGTNCRQLCLHVMKHTPVNVRSESTVRY